MKLNTVNIIEYEYDLISVRSFTDDLEGNKEAETLFSKIVKKKNKNVTKEDMENLLGDGCFNNKVFIVHSNS